MGQRKRVRGVPNWVCVMLMTIMMIMMMMLMIMGGGRRKEEETRCTLSSKRGPNTTGWLGTKHAHYAHRCTFMRASSRAHQILARETLWVERGMKLTRDQQRRRIMVREELE